MTVAQVQADAKFNLERLRGLWVKYGDVACDFAEKAIAKGVSDDGDLPENLDDIVLRACAGVFHREVGRRRMADVGLIAELKPYRDEAVSRRIWQSRS